MAGVSTNVNEFNSSVVRGKHVHKSVLTPISVTIHCKQFLICT